MTDYGYRDGFVAMCHGVLARSAPEVRVIDVSHGIDPFDVRGGSVLLAEAVPHLPRSVHVGVVDPGVGGSRAGIAIETAHGILIGPDNGLLLPAAEALGGALAARVLAREQRPAVATFDGRDVFMPAAARACREGEIIRLGSPVDPTALVRLDETVVQTSPGQVRTEVRAVDTFGNVQLTATSADLSRAGLETTRLAARIGDRDWLLPQGRTFSDAPEGELVVLSDSAGMVAIAAFQSSAVRMLGCRVGQSVVLTAEGSGEAGDGAAGLPLGTA